MNKISIVVPAHNEEDNLNHLMDELIPVLERHRETEDYEIVIVNDNSSDRTPKIIDELAAGNSRIKAVHRSSDPGFGSAIKEGFKNATGDIIIPVMGDLSDD
ncbi:MAG TPA: glycosyltransferase family 2 protein, partial [Candidatus Methanoperedens sp.]|nr:glycosyltransferase family 2 protein [Candidatus Methanoperedens sp.]